MRDSGHGYTIKPGLEAVGKLQEGEVKGERYKVRGKRLEAKGEDQKEATFQNR